MKLRSNRLKLSMTLGMTFAGLLVGSLAFAQQEEPPLVIPIPQQMVVESEVDSVTVTPEGDVIIEQAVRGAPVDQLQVMVDHDLDNVYQYEDEEYIYFYGFNVDVSETPMATMDVIDMSDVDVVHNLDVTGWDGEGEWLFEEGVRGINPAELQPVRNYEIITKRQIEEVQ